MAEVFVIEGINFKKAEEYINKCLELKPDYEECKALKSFYSLKVERDPKKAI